MEQRTEHAPTVGRSEATSSAMLPAQFCPSVLNPVCPLSRLSLPEFQVGTQIPKRLIPRPGNLSVHNPMHPLDKM